MRRRCWTGTAGTEFGCRFFLWGNLQRTSLKLLGFSLALFGLDQLTKYMARLWLPADSEVELLPFFSLDLVSNAGIAFGMLSGQKGIILFTSSTVVILLLLAALSLRRDGRWAIAFSLLLAGSFGNLLDRMFRGEVTDFLKLSHWPTFNLADIYIVAGVLLTTWQILFGTGEEAADER